MTFIAHGPSLVDPAASILAFGAGQPLAFAICRRRRDAGRAFQRVIAPHPFDRRRPRP